MVFSSSLKRFQRESRLPWDATCTGRWRHLVVEWGPACRSVPCNTLLWPSTLFSEGRRSWASSLSWLSWWQQSHHNYSGKLRPRKGNWRWNPVLVLLWQVMVPHDPVIWTRSSPATAWYPRGIDISLHQCTVPCSVMSSSERVMKEWVSYPETTRLPSH